MDKNLKDKKLLIKQDLIRETIYLLLKKIKKIMKIVIWIIKMIIIIKKLFNIISKIIFFKKQKQN
jgi:hypothetical protein